MSSFVKLGLIALGAGVIALPAVSHADDRFDGYCYMRKKEARTNGAIIGAVAGGALGGTVSDTKHKGVGTVLGAAAGAVVGANIGRDSVKCYNGEYHSFERGSYSAPTPPEGYETVYYRSRPDTTYYSRVEYSTTETYNDGNGGYVQKDVHYQGYAPQQGSGQPVYAPQQTYAPPPPAPVYSQTVAQQDYGDRDSNAYRRDDAVEGFRDEDGYWHRGQPRAVGWQDDNGNWHEGRITAYGWRDSQGRWHEDHSQDDHDQDRNNGY